ncbi:MAG: phosphoglycerate kinase [Candidatus Aenigmatarchaeota archaeon]
MEKIFTLDDFDFNEKTVLVRVDINVPYDASTKKIEDSERIREHAITIKELAEKNAKVVVLAHQGRKGDPDFINLNQHASLLSKHVGKKVEFVDDVVGEKAINKIKSMRGGEIVLLDNVRFLEDETLELSPKEHSKSKIVTVLSPISDYFVLDGFSVSHRSHASVVGFSEILPCIAGRIMEKELKALEKFFVAKNKTFVLGGAKVEECLDIIDYFLKKKKEEVRVVLLSGVIAELFLISKGYELGKGTKDFLIKKDYLKFIPQIKEIIQKHGEKIELPIDFAVEVNGGRKEFDLEDLPVEQQILDIGKKTALKYSKEIEASEFIIFKGPAGVYEKKNFEFGTKILLDAITNSKAFSLAGGGDTLTAIEKLNVDKGKFSYISLGGGALITYLSGKNMPGIEILKKL